MIAEFRMCPRAWYEMKLLFVFLVWISNLQYSQQGLTNYYRGIPEIWAINILWYFRKHPTFQTRTQWKTWSVPWGHGRSIPNEIIHSAHFQVMLDCQTYPTKIPSIVEWYRNEKMLKDEFIDIGRIRKDNARMSLHLSHIDVSDQVLVDPISCLNQCS